MDLASFGIGFLAGVLATIATVGVLVFVRVRRMLGGSPFRVRLHASDGSGRHGGSGVETDAEGFIVTSKEES